MNSIEQKSKITVSRRAKNVWHGFINMTFDESLWILIGGIIFTLGTLGVFWMIFRFGWFAGIVGASALWFIYVIAQQYFLLALNRRAMKEKNINVNEIKPGLRVKVIADEGTLGMMISPEILSRRQVGKIGIIKGYVPGHGGDVWFVEQDNGVAAYCFTEIAKN